MSTIILTGGGTAGHCMPNVALIPHLKNKFNKIYYIGSSSGIEKNLIKSLGIPYYEIPCAKLNRSFDLKTLVMPFTVIKGINKAGKIIDKLKPDVIFSKGGYVALPTVIAGHKRKIPVISHESDLTIGLSNRLTSNMCKKVLTAFPETAEKLKNGEYVGIPLRKSLYTEIDVDKTKKSFGLSGKKPVLLITGGSQGAKSINDAVYSALPSLLKKFEIIHLCGKGNLNPKIKENGYKQFEFLSNIEDAIKICSVCVTRAGANTLFELLSLKIPCLVIPLSNKSSRGDQILNAEYFQKLGMINVLNQQSITPNSLILSINSTYANKDNIIKNINKNPIKDASKSVCKVINSVLD